MDRGVRRYDGHFANVQIEGDALLHGDADVTDAVERLYDEVRAALSAETLGACDRMLHMTVEYAKEREQFGRPIGSNQAVKTRIAKMAGEVERMTAAVYYAATQIAQNAADRPLAVAMAKAATAGPGAYVASETIHVHGAIAFTWEHDAHFFTKRVKTNEVVFGDTPASLARIADALL
jgi:alkylation response protein AidB-like acyl-CoA dehydrogenase